MDPRYGEIVPPAKLRRYSAELAAPGDLFKPNHLMSNFISRELARGKAQVTGYTPYIVADVSVHRMACTSRGTHAGYHEVAEQQTGQEC